MITRRGFMAGLAGAGGLVLPSFLERALAHVANRGEPLILPSRRTTEIVRATWSESEWVLSACEPLDSLQCSSVAELWTKMFGSYDKGLWEMHGYTLETLAAQVEIAPEILDEIPFPDQKVPQELMWAMTKTPEHAAFDLLWPLDLHAHDDLDEALGEVQFWECSDRPGSDYYGVHATSDLALSCLQHRLELLGTGIRFELSDGW